MIMFGPLTIKVLPYATFIVGSWVNFPSSSSFLCLNIVLMHIIKACGNLNLINLSMEEDNVF